MINTGLDISPCVDLELGGEIVVRRIKDAALWVYLDLVILSLDLRRRLDIECNLDRRLAFLTLDSERERDGHATGMDSNRSRGCYLDAQPGRSRTKDQPHGNRTGCLGRRAGRVDNLDAATLE